MSASRSLSHRISPALSAMRRAALVLPALFAAPVYAAGGPWYAGFGVGGTQVASWCDGVTGQCDDSGRGATLYGGYEIHRNLAVEGFLVHLGKVNGTDVSLGTPAYAESRSTGFGLAALGLWPVHEQISLFVRGGLARVQTRQSGNALGISGRGKDSTFSPVLGLGAKWNAVEGLVFRVEWARYFDVGDVNFSIGNTTSNSGKDNIDYVGAGAEYRF